MACPSSSSSSCLICSSALLLAFLVLLSPAAAAAAAAAYGPGGRKVGGRTVVRDVESNQEVQELGLFAVHEYNRGMSTTQEGEDGGSGGRQQHRLLTFSRVAAAERQAVAGIMYYLRVVAVHKENDGAREGASTQPGTFDAVVLSKPWLGSRELVSFAPAAAAATAARTNTDVLEGF